MNPQDPNVALIETVAKALGPVNDRVVFVGGSTVGLLITDQARPCVRATQDVDVIAEIASKTGYYRLADELRDLGFREDDDLICRWRLGPLKVDVMPADEKTLGFSNRWYPKAVRDANTIKMPSGREIRIIRPPLLIATKLEAFYDRGNGDYGSSHDIEDVVTLVDGRPELVREIREADPEVRAYLEAEVDDLLGQEGFASNLGWHFGPDATEQARVEIVIERLRQIAGL